MPDDRDLLHPEVHRQTTDASFRGVWMTALVGTLLIVLQLGLILGYFHWQARQQAVEKASTFPLTRGPSQEPPREPRLDPLDQQAGSEAPDINERLALQQARLHEYGSSDEAGFVHIPIEQAIWLVAEELPVQAASADRPYRESGLVNAGDANSGRRFRQEAP